jgi:hypothetical protein
MFVGRNFPETGFLSKSLFQKGLVPMEHPGFDSWNVGTNDRVAPVKFYILKFIDFLTHKYKHNKISE